MKINVAYHNVQMNCRGQPSRGRDQHLPQNIETLEGSSSGLPGGERSFKRFIEMMINSMNRQEAPSTNWLKVYRDMRPSSFKGNLEADPSAGKYWLEQIEKLLEHLECPAKHRVRCANFMLEEEEDIWWKTMAGVLRTQNTV